MASESYESIDVPGVGEVRARPGTSTVELAGAVRYWHDKCRSARLDGFFGGFTLLALIELVGYSIYYAIGK